MACPIFDKNGQLIKIIESHRDITHHVKSEQHLTHRAETDPLTQTFNRNKLNDVLKGTFEVPYAEKPDFAIMIFDLDHFKQINDSYGHDVGDMVLKQVTHVVKSLLRREDVFGRWGGEEFLILLNTSNQETLFHRAESIRQAVAELKIPRVGFVTTSVGIAIRNQGDTFESLIKRADIALYQAKEKGRNRVEISKPSL